MTKKGNQVAAPNKQPCGSRPGPKAPNQHAPVVGGNSKSGAENGGASGKGSGVAAHGTPKPVGNGKRNPLH